MTITSVAGDDPQILNVHVISSATAVATKGDKIAVPIDVSFRMLRTGQVLEDAGDPDNVVPIQLARFPSIPIGVGATWEVPKEISLGSDKWAANATFTVLSVNTHSARLHFTLHLDGTLTGDGGSMRMDGSVDGTFIWRPNLFMPPGMSAALSVRGRMEGVHPDSRGDAACMQMTMGTK